VSDGGTYWSLAPTLRLILA